MTSDLLLDTHAFLWWVTGSDRLPAATVDLIEGAPVVSVSRTISIIPASSPSVLKSIEPIAFSWLIVCVTTTATAPASAILVRWTFSLTTIASATAKMPIASANGQPAAGRASTAGRVPSNCRPLRNSVIAGCRTTALAAPSATWSSRHQSHWRT